MSVKSSVLSCLVAGAVLASSAGWPAAASIGVAREDRAHHDGPGRQLARCSLTNSGRRAVKTLEANGYRREPCGRRPHTRSPGHAGGARRAHAAVHDAQHVNCQPVCCTELCHTIRSAISHRSHWWSKISCAWRRRYRWVWLRWQISSKVLPSNRASSMAMPCRDRRICLGSRSKRGSAFRQRSCPTRRPWSAS